MVKQTQDSSDLRISDLKKRYGIDRTTIKYRKKAWSCIKPHSSKIIDNFYSIIKNDNKLYNVIIRSNSTVERLNITLNKWIISLFTSPYDASYEKNRVKIGTRHVNIGLDHRYVLVALNTVREHIQKILFESINDKVSELEATLIAINKIIDFDAALIGQAYTEARETEVVRPISEAVNCIIVGLDNQLKVNYFNPYAEILTGYPAGEIIGKPFINTLLPNDESTSTRKTIKRIIEKRKSERGHENTISTKSGESRRIQWNGATQFARNGATTGIVIVAQDITEKEHLQRFLSEKEKLISMGKMAVGLVHDIASPLNSIKLRIEELLEDTNDTQIHETLDTVPESIDRISRLARQMLDITKPFTSYKSKINLHNCINKSADLARFDSRAQQAKIISQLTEKPIIVHASEDAILQALLNILFNALEAFDPSSKNIINIETQTTDNHVNLTITDNGPGISEKIIGKIFEPFVTTKGAHAGTGLGLWIAESIITQHDGYIDVKSKLGKGTTFKIVLPIKKSQ